MPHAMYLAYFLQRELSTQIQALLPKYDQRHINFN